MILVLLSGWSAQVLASAAAAFRTQSWSSDPSAATSAVSARAVFATAVWSRAGSGASCARLPSAAAAFVCAPPRSTSTTSHQQTDLQEQCCIQAYAQAGITSTRTAIARGVRPMRSFTIRCVSTGHSVSVAEAER
eukprot:3171148-Rhodomonas_salina.2